MPISLERRKELIKGALLGVVALLGEEITRLEDMQLSGTALSTFQQQELRDAIEAKELLEKGVDKKGRKIFDKLINDKSLNFPFEKRPSQDEGSVDNLLKYRDKISKGASRFKDSGLTLGLYVKAALKQTQLFCLSPDTVSSRILDIMILYKERHIGKKNGNRGKETYLPPYNSYDPEDEKFKPLLEWLMETNTISLALSDSNIQIRKIYSIIEPHGGTKVLNRNRSEVEKAIAAACGHPDMKIPVPLVPEPAADASVTEKLAYERNQFLRGLVQYEYIKGTLEEPEERRTRRSDGDIPKYNPPFAINGELPKVLLQALGVENSRGRGV